MRNRPPREGRLGLASGTTDQNDTDRNDTESDDCPNETEPVEAPNDTDRKDTELNDVEWNEVELKDVELNDVEWREVELVTAGAGGSGAQEREYIDTQSTYTCPAALDEGAAPRLVSVCRIQCMAALGEVVEVPTCLPSR